MITQHNFDAHINNLDALGMMIQLKPTSDFEGGTTLLMPHTFGPPVHFHPYQAEMFQVIQGELEVLKGTKWITLPAGENLLVPAKTPHTFRNSSNEIVVFEFAVTPKIGLTYLLLTLDELVKSGKITSQKDIRSILYMTQALTAYPEVTLNVKPPQWIVRCAAALASLLGFSVEQEQFRAEFMRSVKLWKGPRKKPEDLTAAILEETLF